MLSHLPGAGFAYLRCGRRVRHRLIPSAYFLVFHGEANAPRQAHDDDMHTMMTVMATTATTTSRTNPGWVDGAAGAAGDPSVR